MKKFFIINILGIILCCIILKLILSATPDNQVMKKINNIEEIKDIHAKIGRCYDYSEEYKLTCSYGEDKPAYCGGNFVVILAKSTGKAELYNKCSTQSVIVQEVVHGNTSLQNGTEIRLISNESNTSSFYYEPKDTFERRIKRLPGLGYNISEYPDYFERIWYYNSALNLMKKEHQYLIMFFEISFDDVHFYYMPYAFSYFDLNSDYSKPVITEHGHLAEYCDYYENEMFGSSQEAVDDFYRMKAEILKQYLGA